MVRTKIPVGQIWMDVLWKKYVFLCFQGVECGCFIQRRRRQLHVERQGHKKAITEDSCGWESKAESVTICVMHPRLPDVTLPGLGGPGDEARYCPLQVALRKTTRPEDLPLTVKLYGDLAALRIARSRSPCRRPPSPRICPWRWSCTGTWQPQGGRHRLWGELVFPSSRGDRGFICVFIQACSQPHRVTSGFSTSSNLAQVEYNTKHAHYIHVKHTNIIRKLVPSVLLL